MTLVYPVVGALKYDAIAALRSGLQSGRTWTRGFIYSNVQYIDT